MSNSEADKVINEEIEIVLLKNFIEDEEETLPPWVEDVLNGRYEDIIGNEIFLNVIESCPGDDFRESINKHIEKGIIDYDYWLCVGVASLLYFAQCNCTGPETDRGTALFETQRENALKDLSLHDECNTNVRKPELLYIAKIIFANEFLQDMYKSCAWWLFRANLLHQYTLNEISGVLFDETETLINKIDNTFLLKDPHSETLFYIEAAQFYLYYRRVQNSEKYIESAQDAAKLELNMEGALGKRTKHQTDEKAQLRLRIDLDKNQFPSRSSKHLPKSLELNDDVRLEHTEFFENVECKQLGATEEAIVLAKHIQLQLSQPKDKLTDEEIKPYVNAVIDNTKNWSLKMTSLYHRCSLEASDKRTIERSMMQMEYLVHEWKNAKVPNANRMDMFFASGLKPVWVLEQMWAHLMLNLGLVKGALDIFLNIKLWEEVIICYNLLELKHKAAEIIRQEISKKSTVRLWCLLGDATQDPSHYETAWKLSNEKSSRAQRHWGLFYFLRRNYEEAIPHLKLSVELNNIQESVWIRLGFAALQTEDWKLAATAYKRYCALEQSTFEAWNNLAKAYIKLGDKPKAWKSLQDAIKCDYDRWQVWDNLMVVSIDLGHFSEVIRCYHRILDLKNHHLDVQVLDILTRAVLDNIDDSDGNPSLKLLPKALELFGRITSYAHNDPHVWRMYGQLTVLKRTDIDDEKAAQYLQQAHRAAISDPKWFQRQETVENVLQLCCLLGEMYVHCSHKCDGKKARSLLASAKLTLQGVLKKVKDERWSTDKISTDLQQVEEHLNIIINELEKIKLTN